MRSSHSNSVGVDPQRPCACRDRVPLAEHRVAVTGRQHAIRASLQVAGLRLLQWQSSPQALISAEVVPFRPHRGVLLIVEGLS